MLKKNSYEGEVDIIIPQEIPDNYHKLPVALVKWQPYLNPIHYSVLTYIVSQIHQRRCYAFPSIKTAAEECNICENSFNKGVNLLEALGLIAVERSAKGNKYFLRPPVEPNLKLLEQYFDEKIIQKFKRRKIKDENESSLNFKKVHYFKTKKESSSKIQSQISGEESTAPNEDGVSHEMSINKIYQNLNLPKSNLNSSEDEIQKAKENADVVDLDQVKKIKSYGITSKKAKDLSKKLHPEINLDSFIQYILNDVGKSINIKTTSGFLIHGLSEFQEDFLEVERKKRTVSDKKDKKEKLINDFHKLKEKIENKAYGIYSKFNTKEQENIWDELVLEHDYLKENTISDEIKEGFYIDYIYRKHLKLDDPILNLLSSNPDLITDKDIQYLKKEVPNLKIE